MQQSNAISAQQKSAGGWKTPEKSFTKVNNARGKLGSKRDQEKCGRGINKRSYKRMKRETIVEANF